MNLRKDHSEQKFCSSVWCIGYHFIFLKFSAVDVLARITMKAEANYVNLHDKLLTAIVGTPNVCNMQCVKRCEISTIESTHGIHVSYIVSHIR